MMMIVPIAITLVGIVIAVSDVHESKARLPNNRVSNDDDDNNDDDKNNNNNNDDDNTDGSNTSRDSNSR